LSNKLHSQSDLRSQKIKLLSQLEKINVSTSILKTKEQNLTKSNLDLTKQNEDLTKQNEDLTKQNEDLTKLISDLREEHKLKDQYIKNTTTAFTTKITRLFF
jgi:predicted  nucleic acid-binding Zn-ribbon protein